MATSCPNNTMRRPPLTSASRLLHLLWQTLASLRNPVQASQADLRSPSDVTVGKAFLSRTVGNETRGGCFRIAGGTSGIRRQNRKKKNNLASLAADRSRAPGVDPGPYQPIARGFRTSGP